MNSVQVVLRYVFLLHVCFDVLCNGAAKVPLYQLLHLLNGAWTWHCVAPCFGEMHMPIELSPHHVLFVFALPNVFSDGCDGASLCVAAWAPELLQCGCVKSNAG